MFKTLNKRIVSPANSPLVGILITIRDVIDIFAIQACHEPRTYRCLVFALVMRLFTCSATTLVNTVFICRLHEKTSRFSCLVERVDFSSCN